MVEIHRHTKIRYRGTTLIETAIVFPLLLALTFGAIHYGWLFLKAQVITNAARHGARVAARATATAAEGEEAIGTLLQDPTGALYSYSVVDIPAANPDERPLVRAHVEVPGTDIAIIDAPLLFPTPPKIQATVTMAKEGT